MKKTLIILIMFVICSCSQEEVQTKDLIEDKNTSEMFYEGKLFTGIAINNWKNNKPREEIHYKKGLKHGPYKKRGEYTGNITSKGNYLNGKENGKWISRTPGNVLMAEVEYKDGILNGKFINYYGNGQIKTTGLYKNGKEEGWWEYYHAHKGLIKEVYFEEGIKLSEQQEFELR